jgi:hypothetical protein
VTSFEEKLGRLLDSAVGEPPRVVDANVVRARADRQQKRLRVIMAAGVAVVVAVAVAIPLALSTSHKRGVTVVSGGSLATVMVTPSEQLHNDQIVQVQLRGFPARRQVGLAECPTVWVPTVWVRPDFNCSQAPAEELLTTDGKGSATTSFTVEFAPHAFVKEFGAAKCAPACLLVAATTTGPAVSASTTISFAQPSFQPPPPTRTAEPPGFGVAAASFVTADQGWALGSTGCPGCAGIAVTHDAGKTWSALPSPPASLYWYDHQPSAVSNIAFANNSDGYLFTPGLYATVDGGHSWTDQQLTGVKSLTIAGGYAYALTANASDSPELLYRSQLGSNSWQPVILAGAPGQGQSFTTAAAGSALVLMQNGLAGSTFVEHLFVSTDAGRSWQPRTMPCTVADGGATMLSVAYGHPNSWLMVCFNNHQSSQEQNTEQHLYGTADGGASWVRLADPPQHNAPTMLADNGSGHAFLATEGDSDTLNGTLDSATSWTTSIRDGGSFSGWSDLAFASSTTGYVVGPSRGGSIGTGHLYQTADGGQSWHILEVAP